MSGVKHQTPNVKCQTSNLKCQMSNVKVKHQTSKRQASNIKCQTSNVKRQMSSAKCHTSHVKRQTSNMVWLVYVCVRSHHWVQIVKAHLNIYTHGTECAIWKTLPLPLPDNVQSADVSIVTLPMTSPRKSDAQLNQLPPVESQPRYIELMMLEDSLQFQMFRWLISPVKDCPTLNESPEFLCPSTTLPPPLISWKCCSC